MSSEEKLLWSDNPFWLNYFIHVLILIIIDICGLVAGFFLGQYNQLLGFSLILTFSIVLLVLGIWLIIQLFKWKSVTYFIYDDKIVISKGIINKDMINVMVDKIEFYKVKKSLIDRIWGTGDIQIYTGEEVGNEAEAVLRDVSNIEKVEDILKTVLSG
ncbi:MAG: PH domain-containing protein [Candidatus Helarchaeota archaeon]